MKLLGAWLALVVALLLLSVGGAGSCAVSDQLRRDRECVANIQQHVDRIEAFRTEHGRLPRREELRGGGMSIIDYRLAPAASGTPIGTHQYELRFWRGERSVDYSSATGETTCSSGALKATPWLAGLLFVPGFALLFWSARTIRAARTAIKSS